MPKDHSEDSQKASTASFGLSQATEKKVPSALFAPKPDQKKAESVPILPKKEEEKKEEAKEPI